MSKIVISDVCDVYFRRKRDGKLIFTAEAQLSSISQKIKEEKLKGGIGNRDIAVLRSDKEVALKVRNAIYDTMWLEMACGLEYEEGSKTVNRAEKGLLLTTGAVTITGTPIDGKVTLMASNGTQFVGTYLAGDVTIEGGVDGDLYTAIYQETVAGKVLTIDVKKFSEKYEVEYQTIGYDLDTNTVIKEIIWQFDSVTPSSNFDMSFENGKAISPEIDFTCMPVLGSDEIGRVIELDVV